MTVHVVSSYSEALERLKSIIRSYEQIYGKRLNYIETSINFTNLYPTEKYLELEKFAVVLKKTLTENYDLPIVAITNGKLNFVIDGHHRCYAKYLTGHSGIRAFKIFIENYAPKAYYFWDTMEIIVTNEEVPEEYEYWKAIVKYVEYYRKIYGGKILVKYCKVPLKDVIPTQPYIEKAKLQALVGERFFRNPIVTLEFRGKYYIIDGHARAYIAFMKNISELYSVVLRLQKVSEEDIGIVRTSKMLGLRSLSDVKVLGYS